MDRQQPPRLRPIDVKTFEEDQERHFLLQDPHRLSDEPLILTSLGGWALQYLDGETELEEIRRRFENETGQDLPRQTLVKLIELLDEHYLLENERAEHRFEDVIEDFRNRSSRPSSLPGMSIPEDPDSLNKYFEELLSGPKEFDSRTDADGFFLPHIDYPRGKETYRSIKQPLKEIEDFETILLLGISHHASPVPFSITKKDFETPYGTIETNEDVVDRLSDKLPYSPKDGEIAHRLEHSIEIPLLLFKYLHSDENFTIAPIICSYGKADDNEVVLSDFIEGLETELSRSETILIAGIDFAHMGTQYGEEEPLNERDYEIIRHEDQQMLETIKEANASAFEEHIQKNDNRRRICGYPAIRTFLPLFDEADVLDYDQWQDPEGTVSFGSGLLYR